MNLNLVTRQLVPWAMAFSALLSTSVCKAALMVEAAVTPDAPAFHYDLAVINDTPVDVVVVSLIDAPLFDPVIAPSLSAPAGFVTNYDPLLGIVDLIADTAIFGAGFTVDGFAFDSLLGPLDSVFTRFQALTVDGELLNGDVVLRQVQVNLLPTLVLMSVPLIGVLTASGGALCQFKCEQEKENGS